MRHLFTFITALVAILLIFTGRGLADDQDELLSRLEQQVVERINLLRADPLRAAADLGLDPLRVLADFPLMAAQLESGMAPLMRQPILELAANTHTKDMFAKAYVDSVSPAGTTSQERMIAAGYDPNFSAERVGALTFINFIPTETVLDLILDTMFKAEFDPQHPDHLTFLDPDLKEIGLGLGTGKMLIGGRSYQACLLTVDLGSPSIGLSGSDILWVLINQARSDTSAAVIALGLDPQTIIDRQPHLAASFGVPLTPLRKSDPLSRAAQAQVDDMAQAGFFSHTGSDGSTPEERATAAGYDGTQVAERMSRFDLTTAMNIKDLAAYCFRRMLIAELNAPVWDNLVILNPHLSDVGIAVTLGIRQHTSGEFGHLFLAAVSGGRSQTVFDSGIVGVVYSDRNADGRFSAGEGLADSTITLDGRDIFFGEVVHTATVSDSAGSFEALIAPAVLSIAVETAAGGRLQTAVTTGWQTRWLALAVDDLLLN